MSNEPRDPQSVPYEFCATTEEALDALRHLRHADRVAADTETEIVKDADGNPIQVDFDVEGPGPWRVMSIAARFGHGDNAYYKAWVLDMKYVDASALWAVFKGIIPWGWNANFDRGVVKRDGLPIHKWMDGMIFDAVLKQGAYWATGGRAWYTSLEAAAEKYLGVREIEGKEDTRYSYNMRDDLTEEQKRYAADDAVVTLWTGEVLEVEVKKHGLYDTAIRGNGGQPFIDGFGKSGLALDRATYQGRVDEAQAKADAAAERIAVATTGKELLTTIVRWDQRRQAEQTGKPVAELDDERVIERGLEVLKNERAFADFLAALRSQLSTCREQMAALTGAGDAVEDLFSNEVRFELPFDPDNETTLRRWITKTAPLFTAEYIAAAGTGSKQLVKAHDLDDVYLKMTTSQAEDLTTELRQLALVLASYKRYSRIVGDYGDVVGAVNLKPDWNINSGDQVKGMLNTYCEAEVSAYTLKKDGHAHPLGKTDAVDSDALKLIGGELANALLAFREQNKTVTTYGEEWLKAIHHRTGRVHGKYTQDLTGTGRLSSYSPNMQNASIIKPYAFPPRDAFGRVTRVLVCADLSQAELRFVADMSGDENMLGAFRSGEDLHERTASLMNTIDMKALKVADTRPLSELADVVDGVARFIAERPDLPAAKLYKELRSKAKAVAFGYAYGLKGASLSRQLTVQGVPTTKEEADELLAKFDIAYPQLAAWMAGRVAFIQSLSDQMKDQSAESGCDFEASWRLHRLYAKAFSAQKSLRSKLGRKPTHVEIAEALVSDEDLRARLAGGNPDAEITDEDIAASRQSQAENVAWALGHYGSTVLAADGTPWSFESRTKGGRRRLLQVGTKDWVMAMIGLTARSRKKFAADIRDAWVATYNAAVTAEHEAGLASGKIKGNTKVKTVSLTKVNPRTHRPEPLNREELEKAFEDNELKLSFISFVLAAYDKLPDPAAARDYLFRHAMADRIRAMGNQYRNHPIQGGVADAVLDAYAVIDDELRERFPTAQGVQSVHDSIVVECDLQDAIAVRELVVRHMEACLAAFCPNVPCRADGDIQLSLDDKTIVTDEQVNAMISDLALAA